MKQPYSQLLKNAVIIYAVEIASRGLVVLFLIYAARIMGVKNFGDFSYAMAILMIASVISEFGASNLLVKMTAQKNSVGKNFWTYTFLRVIITVVTVVFVMAYLYAANAEKSFFYFFMFIGIGMVFGCYWQNAGFVLRGLNKMHLDGLIRLSFAFLSSLLSIFSLRLGLGISGIGIAYLISYFVTAIIAHKMIREANMTAFRPVFDPAAFKYLIRVAAIFCGWMIISVFYSRIDTILIKHLKGSEDVGIYSAAARVIDVVMIIPGGIYMGILPILSRAVASNDKKSIESLSRVVMKYMTYLGVFIACCLVSSSNKIIELVYFAGEYWRAVVPLQILACSAVASFVYIVPSALLASAASPQAGVLLSLVATVINVIGNIIFIPKWGVVGSSVVRAATEFIGLVLLVAYVNRYVCKIRYRSVLAVSVVAALITSVVMTMLKSLLFVPLYMIVYVLVLYLLKGISLDEFTKLKDLLFGGAKE